MARTAILHIGPMKTGSTSIQFWLDRNAADLAAQGRHVPTSLGRNMSSLAYIAQAQAFDRELSALDNSRVSALRTELAALPAAIHTVIFSGEMIGQILNEAREIQALRSMLDEFFNDYVIVTYLRRQDELSLSRYSTSLRRGEKRARPLSKPFDYEVALNLWSEAFGREALRVRLFDREVMPEGDVVRDFAEAAGLPYHGTGETPLNRNPSLLPEAQLFLAMLADAVRTSGFKGTFLDVAGYDQINRSLNRGFTGPGAKPTRSEAIAFCERVEASNERVRATWFPDRDALFSGGFSAYPEAPEQPPSAERVLDVALAVLTALVTARKPAITGEAPPREREDRTVRATIRREKRQGKSEGRRKRRSAHQSEL